LNYSALCLLLSLLSAPFARAQHLLPDDGQSHEIVITDASLLHDPSGGLSIDSVAARPANDFTKVDGQLALGFTHDAIWLRLPLDLPEAGPRRWLLEVSPPYLDEVTLYVPQADGHFHPQREGDLQPVADRSLPNRNFLFDIPRAQAGTHIYYLRVRTSSALQLRLGLWQPAGLIARAGLDGALYGAFVGMALLVIGFNLIFWRWLRDRLYFSYARYVAVSVLSYAMLSGYGQILLPDWPLLGDLLQKVLVLAHLGVAGLFFGELLRFAPVLPRLHRANRWLSYGWLGLGGLTGLGLTPYWGQVILTLGFAQVTILEGVACWLIWRGRRDLLVYLIAFLLLYFGYFLTTARAVGWLGNAEMIDYLPLVATAVHMVLINIGLAQRARQAEDARRAAEQVTLSMSPHHERELEARVTQRTRALEEANAALQREIAERTELQSQLRAALATEREARSAQRQFVAMVSHEFRTPLAIIDATAQRILLQHRTEADTLTGPLGKIRRAVQRLNGLIATFLGEEQQPTQGHAVAREVLDLYALAHAGAEQHRSLSSGLIDCQPPTLPVRIVGDGALLALVLSSLVDNALKYSPPGSPVTLRVGCSATRGWVDVVDYGAGIALEDRERVFDKHVRLGVVSGVGGTGLGLYIARNATRRMGGDIELDSEPGKGSSFRLWLPLADNSQPG
jgi:signal transduction histidine kinase